MLKCAAYENSLVISTYAPIIIKKNSPYEIFHLDLMCTSQDMYTNHHAQAQTTTGQKPERPIRSR